MISFAYLTSLNVFLIWLSVVSLILFSYCWLKLRNVNKKLGDDKKDEDKKWQELEAKAQRDYEELIHAANKKAEEIISKATKLNEETKITLENSASQMLENQKNELQNRSNEISKQHEEEIKELNNNIVLLLTNIYKDIESSTRTDLEKYKEAMRKQTFEAEQLAQTRMKEEYEKLEKEIEEKKKQKLQDLENNIYKIITIISKDIIGKSLDLSSHQEIIIKSLDDAKKEGII